jgi:hypothetical protein
MENIIAIMKSGTNQMFTLNITKIILLFLAKSTKRGRKFQSNVVDCIIRTSCQIIVFHSAHFHARCRHFITTTRAGYSLYFAWHHSKTREMKWHLGEVVRLPLVY